MPRKLYKPRDDGTERRDKIMQYLKEHSGVVASVSIRELADYIGTSTSVITFHLDRLEREGKIEREPEKARSIRILEEV